MKNKVKIIAEAGINHNGDFKKLIKLIDIAKKANADFVKFQLFKTKNFINKKFSHKKVDYEKVYKRFQSLEFSFGEWKKAIQYGNKIGIRVFIKNKKNNKGLISFEYSDLDQLNKIIDLIKNNY